MPILPNNTDPLQDYVSGNQNGSLPPLTLDGLVYNKVYAQTGVIDSLNFTERTGYTDPNTNIINGFNNATAFGQTLETNWISSQDFGGPDSTPVLLTYNLAVETDLNIIDFELLNVPCYVELFYKDLSTGNMTAFPGSSTFSISGGSDIYSTSNFIFLEYQSPSTVSTKTIYMRITRTQQIQSINNGIATNVAYSVGVQTFSIRLQIILASDIPADVLDGSQTITTQNRLGFIENYSYKNYPVTNIFANDTAYWKSAPQPTGDSIVYFYACINDTTPSSINRLYIDPLYSGCRFNIYFTTQSTNNGTISPDTFLWTPIQRDFTLRKGIYELPTTSATYLKFEFVKLIPEAYDLSLEVVPRTINVFPADVEEYYYQLEDDILDGNSVKYSYLGNNNNPQTATTTSLNSSTLFGLSSNTLANPNTWPQLSALNDSQMGGNTTTVGNNTNSYIIDPTISYKTIDNNGNYNGVAYNQFLQRRFTNVQQHLYTQVSLNQSWHEAYFTGIQYLTAFYEQQYDDIRSTPGNLISANPGGFSASGINYVGLQPDQQAYTQWYPTLETFKSFNIGALTSEWQSFLSDDVVLLNNPSWFNNSTTFNCSPTQVGDFGNSTIYSISPASSGTYGVQSLPYAVSNNVISYDDANFNSITNWVPSGTTTITGTTITLVSGVCNGLTVSGGNFTAIYNFKIPNVGTNGEEAWKLQFAAPGIGTVGYGTYIPATGTTAPSVSYNFYVGVQVAGVSGISTVNGSVSALTQFYNPTTSGAIANTIVSGTTNAFTISGTNIGSVTSASYSGGLPSNTIQFVVSGSGVGNYNLYQLAAFASPQSTWISPVDRNYMRVSSLTRMMLPLSNQGAYLVQLCGSDVNGNVTVLTQQQFNNGYIPLNTWFDVMLEAFTGQNFSKIFVKVTQTNPNVNEQFYLSAFSAFYHPIRFEYSTVSGATYPNTFNYITGNINDPKYFVATTSGLPASGIQLRMTSLDPNVFISGISVIPYYKSNPYYAELNIDYIGNSKTNELSSRRAVSSKPFFQNNHITYPERFSIPVVVGPNVGYIEAEYGY
jgi:hypothetical protein